MSSPFNDQMEAALAELRAQQQKIKEFSAGHAERRTTVLSKNRMISATVDTTGRLVELAFKGNRYRNLPPAELASLVVSTVAKAQQTASKESLDAAKGLIPGAFDIAGMLQGDLDIDSMFDAAARLAQQPIFADEVATTEPAAGKERTDG